MNLFFSDMDKISGFWYDVPENLLQPDNPVPFCEKLKRKPLYSKGIKSFGVRNPSFDELPAYCLMNVVESQMFVHVVQQRDRVKAHSYHLL